MTHHGFAKNTFPPNSYDLDRNPATSNQLQHFKGITETSTVEGEISLEGEYGVYFPHSTSINFQYCSICSLGFGRKSFRKKKVLFKTFFIISAVGILSAGEAVTAKPYQANDPYRSPVTLAAVQLCAYDFPDKKSLIPDGTQCCFMSKKGEGWSGVVLVYLYILYIHLNVTPIAL